MLPLLQPWQCTGVAESLRLLGSADEQLLQQLQTKAENAMTDSSAAAIGQQLSM